MVGLLADWCATYQRARLSLETLRAWSRGGREPPYPLKLASRARPGPTGLFQHCGHRVPSSAPGPRRRKPKTSGRLLGKSLGRRSASNTTDRRDRDGNDLLSWQAFVARERAPCSEREKVADHRVECTATAASGRPA